jgi:prophage regulatory protein
MPLKNSQFAGSDSPAPSPARLESFLTRSEIEKLTGLSYTTIWRRMKAGDFPLSVPLSPKRVGWTASSVAEWMQVRIDDANSK